MSTLQFVVGIAVLIVFVSTISYVRYWLSKQMSLQVECDDANTKLTEPETLNHHDEQTQPKVPENPYKDFAKTLSQADTELRRRAQSQRNEFQLLESNEKRKSVGNRNQPSN
jgi:hypothetical protein